MNNPFKDRQIFKVEKVDSTNNYASTLSYDTPEGSIVWTLEQTQGRGQGTNKWESEPFKNLTFSIILHPTWLLAEEQFYLSKIISLAISDLIKLFTDNVSIKWPNDVYVANGKIAGILIENSIEGQLIMQSIAGIGININQQTFSTYAPNPLSLKQLTGNESDLSKMLNILCELIAFRYLQLKKKDFQTINDNYHHALYRLNQRANFIANGEKFEGMIIDVEPNGTLIVCEENKKIRKFLHKEVEFVL